MKKQIECFFLSLLYSVLALIFIALTLRLDLSIFEPIFSPYKLNIFKLIKIGTYAFMCLFVLSGCITFVIAAIKNIILFHYFLITPNDDKTINVTVDENYIIRDSFLELSNGKIIPIKIKKIVMNKPENESKEENLEVK